MTNLSEIWPAVEETAQRCGAAGVGASPLVIGHQDRFSDWLARGQHAGMRWLEKSSAARSDPSMRFPWARSVVVITVPYPGERPSEGFAAGIARYALGEDYHAVVDEMLKTLEAAIATSHPHVMTRRYVDTGPLSDRSYAVQAGLGWIGRNAMLIDPRNGSYLFIGLLLTSAEFDLDEVEVSDHCGACNRCVEACPTDAITAGRMVDSERCISYVTIEQRGAVADAIKPYVGQNLFGCDVCQEVCPWNEHAAPGLAPFEVREKYRGKPVTALLRMTQAEFSSMFRGSAIKRAKREGIVRNAVLVSDHIAEQTLSELTTAPEAGVRDAAQWRSRR